jgi:hypothetical protein
MTALKKKMMQPMRQMARYEGEVFGNWMLERKKPSWQEMNIQAVLRKI